MNDVRGWLVLDMDDPLVGHRRPPLEGVEAAWDPARVVAELGADPSRLLIVDDSPWAISDPAHHVPIPPFVMRNARAVPADALLLELRAYLDTLSDAPDVREVDKTGWLEPRWTLPSRAQKMTRR
jgi:hypothetical protein